MEYDILSPVDDWIFKLLFGDERNKDILISLLKGFIELPEEEYELIFLDTHLKPENEDEKLGILDVKVKTKSGKIINIEIQVNPEKNIGKRLSFYKSKLITEQISAGDDYNVIQKVICICITKYDIFPQKKDYLNSFRFYNNKNNLHFEDIPEEIYTLELKKVPDKSDGTDIWNWMKFFLAKQKEEFEMVAAKTPEIRKAVDTLYELSTDEEIRAVYEQRMKAWRDRVSSFNRAIEDRIIAVAQKMKKAGKPESEIAEFTDLPLDTIRKL